MLTKKEFKNQIIEGIKAGHGHLDPCNGEGFGDEYTYLPLYYWTVEDDQVVEELPFLTDAKFRFGISVSDVENFTEKCFSESSRLSDDEVKQAMLGIIEEYGVDDWYDQYQQSLKMED